VYKTLTISLAIIISLELISSEKLQAQLPKQMLEQEKINEKMQSEKIDSLIYDLFFDSDQSTSSFTPKKNYHFLYLRTNYGTKTFYAGREIGLNQGNLLGQLYYFHSKGFFTGISGAWFSEMDPGYRITSLSAGISKSLRSSGLFHYRMSFNYFLFNGEDYKPDYNSSLNAGGTLKGKWLGTRIDGAFLLGNETGFQLYSNTYLRLNLIRLNRLDRIQTEPSLGLFWGSETLYELAENAEFPLVYKDSFGLLNMQVEIPLQLTWKSFDLELSWIKNFPQSSGSFDYPSSSFFEIALGYFISL